MSKVDLVEASMSIAKRLTKEEINAVEMTNAHEYGFRVGAQRAAYLMLKEFEPYFHPRIIEEIVKRYEN